MTDMKALYRSACYPSMCKSYKYTHSHITAQRNKAQIAERKERDRMNKQTKV